MLLFFSDDEKNLEYWKRSLLKVFCILSSNPLTHEMFNEIFNDV